MTKRPHRPRQGQAWREDWPAHLATLLKRRGYDSVTAFLKAHPRQSLVELADGFDEDVAAAQLEWTFLDEAKASGGMEACARDLLARNVHQYFPTGWDHDDTRAHGLAFSGWSAAIKARTGATVDTLALWEALDEAAPAGWLPVDADDPLIVQVFRTHWSPP